MLKEFDAPRRQSAAADLEPAGQAGEAPPIHDCWNLIGVQGNGTCAELRKFVHCRNCPSYRAAAILLLDRPLTADYRREWTRHFALEKKLTVPARASVLIFRVHREWLALPTAVFQEVAEPRTIHALPHRRNGIVLGLANVRGELVICASLGRMLGLPPETAREKPQRVRGRLLVASWQGNRSAFPVDEVHGVYRVGQDQLRPPPATVARSRLTYTQGVFSWGEWTVGYLNAEALFPALDRSLS